MERLKRVEYDENMEVHCPFSDCYKRFNFERDQNVVKGSERGKEALKQLEIRYQKHVECHLDLHSITCRLCGWRGRPDLFSRHLFVHRRDRFLCPLTHCDLAYAHVKALQSHIRANHCGEMYSCQLCTRQFARMESLSRHIGIYHKNEGIPAVEMVKDNPFYRQMMLDKALRKNLHERTYRLLDGTKVTINIRHFIQVSYFNQQGQVFEQFKRYPGLFSLKSKEFVTDSPDSSSSD